MLVGCKTKDTILIHDASWCADSAKWKTIAGMGFKMGLHALSVYLGQCIHHQHDYHYWTLLIPYTHSLVSLVEKLAPPAWGAAFKDAFEYHFIG